MRKVARKIFVLILFSAPSIQSLFSQDSAKTFVEKEIVIFGNRISIKERLLPSPVTVLTTAQLQLLGGTSVASAIKEIPSVFVRSYGGKGSLQLLSTRGMGGEYTVVLVDGERFSSAQDNLADLGIFLSDDVEQIELAKGGYSSLIGSSAVSGILNIVTKKPTKEFHASANSSLGSFGFQSTSISLSGGGNTFRLKSSFSMERARNDYGFEFSDGLNNYKLRRSGADYSIKNAGFRATADIQENMEGVISARYSTAERGYPSGVSSPRQNNLARIKDDNLFLVSSLNWHKRSNTFFSLAPRFHYFRQHYRNPNSGDDDYSVSRVGGITISLQRNLSEQDKLRGELESVFAGVTGSNLGMHTRFQSGISFSSEHHFFNSDGMVLYPSFRIDGYERMPLAFSPRIGVNVCLMSVPEIRFRSSAGKSFRAPTFNELYYQPGGNPNLNPEKSLSGDAGVLLFFEGLGTWKVENNLFFIDTKDRIVWMPGEGSTWSPKNVYRVVSSGVELNIQHSLMDNLLSWNASYSYMEVTRKDAGGASSQTHNKQLVYTPYELASVSLLGTVDPVSASLRHSYTGFRYINENNNPNFILPSFQATDVVVAAKVAGGGLLCVFKAEIQNIFDSQYQWIPQFPVPGRSFALTGSLYL